MFYYGERVVEMMQQRLPPLVRLGFPEALGVILETSPANQKQVAVRVLNAAMKFVGKIARGRTNDRFRFAKRGLKLLGLTWSYIENSRFQNHRGLDIWKMSDFVKLAPKRDC